jgi:tRNA(Arg) A34 adenosine deaminase TadA
MDTHEKLMQQAIQVAEDAYRKGCPPYGVVIVQNGSIIGRGYNCVEMENDPTAHSEVQAIRDACRSWGHIDLAGCDLYTVYEPCQMCAAAIVWARIETVYIGARNAAFGAAISTSPTTFETMKNIHPVKVVSGILKDECQSLIARVRQKAASDGGA